MAAPLVAGRDFTAQDDETGRTCSIVNQAFADRFFPGESALGKRLEPGAISTRDHGSRVREIVGIAGDARQSVLAGAPEPIYYVPYKQMLWGAPALVVRATGSAAALETAFRRTVAAIDGDIALDDVRTFEDALSSGLAPAQLVVLFMGGLSLVALLLTATGLHGLLAYAVQQRTRGDRRPRRPRGDASDDCLDGHAAGARPRRGGTGSREHRGRCRRHAAPAPARRGRPTGVRAAGLACTIVALTAVIASYVPARRAASVDPMDALRSE